MPTPINLMSICQLIDYLVAHEEDEAAIFRLSEKLSEIIGVEQAANLITDLMENIRGLNRTDTDNIRQNALCMAFGKSYWSAREKILEVFSDKKQFKLFNK